MGAAPNLRPGWKPGQSGNPGGRAKLPEELRAIKALTQEEVARYVAKYARMGSTELDALVLARSVPMLELAIARIFQEAEAKGDFTRLSFLLDRAIGKVQVVEITDASMAALEEISALSTPELIKLVRDKLPALEEPE